MIAGTTTAENRAENESVPPAGDPDYIRELELLAQLRDKGVITEEDYDAKKKQLLGL